MTKQSIVLGTVSGVIVSVVLGVLGMVVLEPVFSAPMFERTKWVSDYFSVGTTEQFHVASNGELTIEAPATVAEFTQGGGILDLADANGGTYTLTQAELLGSSVLKFTAGGAGQAVIALTLPASSTLTSLLPNAGDMREWIYDASALAVATTTTITAGTGVDLIGVTTNDDVIDGLEFARLTCWRQTDTDVSCITSELLHVD